MVYKCMVSKNGCCAIITPGEVMLTYETEWHLRLHVHLQM